jgi:hypothetical protein
MMPGQPGGSQDYDFATLYGMADHSAGFLYPEGWYDAVVEDASYGRSKDGSKGQWTVKFRTTTGDAAGRSPLTTTLSISPVKQDGTQNTMGLGILFRHLAALGVPVPDPAHEGQVLNGQAPFWVMRWTYENVAQVMVGRPAKIKVVHDEYDGVTRNKIRDIRPAQPGAPTTWPQQQAQQQGFAPGGFNPQPPDQQFGQPQPGAFPGAVGGGVGYQGPPQDQNPYANPYTQPAANTGPGYQQPGYGQPPAGTQQPWAQPPAQQPWQQPSAPTQQGQPPVPGAPQWAQPPQPGQGGYGEFTQPGQSQQPAANPGVPPVPTPPWQQQQQTAVPPVQWQPPQPGQQSPQAPPAQQGGPGEAQPGQAPWMQ